MTGFTDIIQIVTMFIKTIFKTQKRLKELEIMYQNGSYICISWFLNLQWKHADG